MCGCLTFKKVSCPLSKKINYESTQNLDTTLYSKKRNNYLVFSFFCSLKTAGGTSLHAQCTPTPLQPSAHSLRPFTHQPLHPSASSPIRPFSHPPLHPSAPSPLRPFTPPAVFYPIIIQMSQGQGYGRRPNSEQPRGKN